ncbi:MAG TPA: discoidin domain-containing protein [Polyangia bacterium]|jgi:hypothetical protein
MPATNRLKSMASVARDALLLERPLAQVATLSLDRQVAMRIYFDAATRLSATADQLTDEDGAAAALILYREALPSLVVAVAMFRDPSYDAASAGAASPWETLDALAARGAIPPLPPHVGESKAILADHGPLGFDEGTDDERLTKRRTVQTTVTYLHGLVEPRSVPELKADRLTRVAGLLVVLVLALAWSGYRLVSLPNIALHKPVTISGRFAFSSAPADNTGLVNGEIEPAYGIHTSLGSGWVMVDLQKTYRLSRVKIYNRADTLFDEGLPMTLEVSKDGVHFDLVDRRTTTFSATSPWVFVASSATPLARFVRVASKNFVALTEIEVFGRRAD